MSGPCVSYLLEQPDLQLTVADQDLENARLVVGDHPRGETMVLDVDREDPRPVIRDSDIVVNLLPAGYMSTIARICAEEGVHMVGATYATEDMKTLHRQAEESDTLLLTEVGLDPGIDHMMAARTIDELRGEGATIEGYRSLCGAIPAHGANDNPFGYKFSWSPSGALGAAKRPAWYLEGGHVVEIPGDLTMKSYALTHVPGAGWFEFYPNGNALPYRELYGIEEVSNLYRGTYRYVGWCETLAAMVKLGALDEDPLDLAGLTYRQLTAHMLEVEDDGDLRAEMAKCLGVPGYSAVLERIEWLGLLDDENIPQEKGSPRDVTAQLMLDKLVYAEDERDMVVMTHEYVVRYPDGQRKKLLSTFLDYGEPGGFSSIARTTGLPVAVACKLVADGTIDLRGVQIPVSRSIYEPSLAELERLGIRSHERVELQA